MSGRGRERGGQGRGREREREREVGREWWRERKSVRERQEGDTWRQLSVLRIVPDQDMLVYLCLIATAYAMLCFVLNGPVSCVNDSGSICVNNIQGLAGLFAELRLRHVLPQSPDPRERPQTWTRRAARAP